MSVNWLRLSPQIALGVANAVIAGLVWARDFKKLNNRTFASFALAIGIWVLGISGFLLSQDKDTALVWARIYYLAPLLVALSGYLFAASFPTSGRLRSPFLYPLFLGFASLATILLFKPGLFITGLIYHSWGKEVLLNEATYGVYSAFIIFFFAVILLTIYHKSKQLKGLYALQANLFFKALSTTAAFALLFNLVLPLFHNYRLINLGPLFTSISVTAIGYSIVRHRMFDIRSVVARSLGYAISLVVVAASYGFVVFSLGQLLFNLHLELRVQIFLSVATGIAGLTFGRFRKVFDRLTNKVFFQDAYDPQDVFDNLNRVLVSTVNLEKMAQSTTRILADELKAEFSLLGLKEIAGKPQRVIGTAKFDVDIHDVLALRHQTVHYKQSVIITDYLEGEKYEPMKFLLQQYNIAVLVRLTPNLRRDEEGLGYLALGPKKSGNPYSIQDARVLDTVAKELIIAIQNALHFEEIQNFNETLQQKVVEATNKLRRTNEKLKEMDETKDDFISMASHQLRTPLTSVKGYLSMVLEGDAGKINGTQREMLGQAFFSSQRMVYLIADLLNVSRLKTGKFVMEPSTVNLAEMVGQEMSQLNETAAAKDLTLTYDKPYKFPDMMLDETKTRQVIMNFMDNAIYYTPNGGHIAIELIDKPKTVELRIVDDGIGVPKSEQYHLFTKFYRAANARKARPDGTGLGLFMAKKVITAQDGLVIFESQEGKGSTFGFSFAKTAVQADEPAIK